MPKGKVDIESLKLSQEKKAKIIKENKIVLKDEDSYTRVRK
jgi:hypothetical protein